MTIDLYYTVMGSGSRSVLLLAKFVGVELNLKLIDMRTGDHMKPEFIKKNPQHTTPTLDDNGFVLADSRAIMGYLVDQYAKDDSLYPKDPKKRALVNQRLDFDICIQNQMHYDVYHLHLNGITAHFHEKINKKLDNYFGVLEKFLETDKWVAGSNMTIADIAMLTTVPTFSVLGYSWDKFPNVCKWLENCKKAIPWYGEVCQVLAEMNAVVDLFTRK